MRSPPAPAPLIVHIVCPTSFNQYLYSLKSPHLYTHFIFNSTSPRPSSREASPHPVHAGGWQTQFSWKFGEGRGHVILPLLVSTPLLGMVTPSWPKPPPPKSWSQLCVNWPCRWRCLPMSHRCVSKPPPPVLGGRKASVHLFFPKRLFCTRQSSRCWRSSDKQNRQECMPGGGLTAQGTNKS